MYVALYFLLSVIAFCLVMGIKNSVTYINHKRISDAIHIYRLESFKKGIYEPEVDYEDSEEYFKTLFRLWDWGYTRILPKEKFDIIKPYFK